MGPYLPQALPIAELNWEPLIPYLSQANRSLARYDGVLEAVPNPQVLLTPLTTNEAVLSSRIEGTRASLGEVFEFEAGNEPEEESKRVDVQEILNYRRALSAACTALREKPFNLNLLRSLHADLLASVRGDDKARGEFRKVQNWIGPPGSSIDQAAFVPPRPQELPDALSRWINYYHEEERDVLVQLAIVHAQFEILHPFEDGNGRLGRILIPLFLFERKILKQPVFYLSEWLDSHRDEYIQKLRSLGRERGAWNQWVEFFLKGMTEQAGSNTQKARDIFELYKEMKERVLALTHSQYAIPLLDQLFARPLFLSRHLEFGAHAPSRASINHLLRTLVDGRVIEVLREGRGRRPTTYAFAALINLCEGKQVLSSSTAR